MKRYYAITMVICCLSAMVVGCSKKEPSPSGQATGSLLIENPQKAAPLNGLTFVKGEPVTLDAGKVYVVEFWATWCGPCRASIPHLTELQKQFSDKGVTMIGISDEAVNTVKAFVEKMGDQMDYTVAVDARGAVGKGYMEAYHQQGIPTAFVVDGAGDVVWVGHPMDNLDAAISKALEQSAPNEVAAAVIEPAPTPVPAEPVNNNPEPETTLIKKAAPLDGLTYIKGEPVTLKDGNVYVVEFWATWCGPCRQSIPHLTDVQGRYKDKGVTVIGISNESELDTVKNFVAEMGDTMNYTVALDPERKVGDGYMKAYDQRGIPTAFIIDASGRVVWVGHPLADLDEVLEQVVAGDFDAEVYAKTKTEREEKMQQFFDLANRFMKGMVNGDPKDTLDTMAQQLLSTDDPQILNSLAWTILTEIPQDRRDLKAALLFAKKAADLTKSEDPGILDTYALALFGNGRYAEAVENQSKALQIITDMGQQVPADMQQRLEQFKKKLAELAV